MTSAQIGKTEMLLNALGYFVDYDPSPMLLLQPTIEMAEAFSKDRLAPMVRDTPALRDRIAGPKSRASGNTLLHKSFPGGHITMAGANSPASLASRPVRILYCDEVDRYPASAGTEGDPVSLAKKRTTTFWNRKTILTSTPTIMGASRIADFYAGSDQRRFFVPCPHCGEYIVLRFGTPESSYGVKWPDGRPDLAYYLCEHCACPINEGEKAGMVRRGEWRATAEFTGIAGFHLNELYSPWVSMAETVANFIEAKKLPETLKTWINTAMGECWEEKGDAIEDGALLSRRESYGPDIPQGASVLTAGVDTQDDRLEIEVVAWGENHESWSMEYSVIHGDPAKPEIWEQLDDYLSTHYKHANGRDMRVAATCIDSGGHHTQSVYRYAQKRYGRRIFATKGVGGAGKLFVPRAASKNASGSVPVFMLGVDTGKEMLYSRLKIKEHGPGFCHFPEHYDGDYFAMLTAEKVITSYAKGVRKRAWVKKAAHLRNEALDCRVLAMAAFEIVNPNMARMARKVGAAIDAESGDNEEAEPARPRAPPFVQKYKQKRGGFVSGWKK